VNPTQAVRQVRVGTEIAAPPAAVWDRISEHEDTPSWVEAARRVRLVRPGTPSRNGVGAVRVVEFKPRLWSDVHERITRFEPPRTFEYVLFEGMPGLRDHLGKLIVDDLGDSRSRLRWEVDFEFRRVHPFRLFLPTFMRDFETVLSRAVGELQAQLEGQSSSYSESIRSSKFS
jgi:uncharacterized protein YndB with AHSA1/START domain